MPKYYIEKREEHMFRDEESQRKNLYYILNEIGVKEEFLWKHVDWIDEATKMEKKKKTEFIQEKINAIEAKGGKTNYYDMEEMYGRVHDLWKVISETQKLPEAFIEKYSEKLNWHSICRNQKLSDDFMRKHKEKLNWWAVAYFQDYSEEFLLEFFTEIMEAVSFDNPKHDMFNGFLRIREVKDPKLILLLKMNNLM
jgi:hypothetical protein